MQTKRQVMTKIRSMMKAARAAVIREADHLLDSGGIDLEGAEDDFRLPKLVLMVAMRNAADSRATPYWTKEEKAIIKNLTRF